MLSRGRFPLPNLGQAGELCLPFSGNEPQLRRQWEGFRVEGAEPRAQGGSLFRGVADRRHVGSLIWLVQSVLGVAEGWPARGRPHREKSRFAFRLNNSATSETGPVPTGQIEPDDSVAGNMLEIRCAHLESSSEQLAEHRWARRVGKAS